MRWFPLTFLMTVALASGAGAAELTMEESVLTALDNNPTVQAASERSLAAGARSKQAKGHRWFSLNLSEIYSYTNNPAEVFAFKLNQGRFDFGEFTMTDPNDPDWLTTWITRLELTVPIYTGGQLGNRINQADHMASAEELRLAHTRDKVVFDTITAYTNLAKARDQVALMTTSRETTAEHVEIAQAYAGQGLILEAEVLKAKGFPGSDGRAFGAGQQRCPFGRGRSQLRNGHRSESAATDHTHASPADGPRRPRRLGRRGRRPAS